MDKGADVNGAGGCFRSALMAALYGNHWPATKLLLEHGASVNLPPPMLGTALYYSCRYMDMSAMRILLDYGADVNADGSEGESSLTVVISSY